MFDDCINKKCEAIVFMGEQWGEASIPLKVSGVFDSYNDEYIIIRTTIGKGKSTRQGKSYVSIKALLVLNIEE